MSKNHRIPVGIEVDAHVLVMETVEEHVLLHHPIPELLYLPHLVIILTVHPALQLADRLLPVPDLLLDPLVDRLVLRLPGRRLRVAPGVKRLDI